jgi:hypothetical protein
MNMVPMPQFRLQDQLAQLRMDMKDLVVVEQICLQMA